VGTRPLRAVLLLGALVLLSLLAPLDFLAGRAPAAPLDQACPPVAVNVSQSSVVGQLQVAVNAGTNTQELRFGEPRASTNERVSFPGGPTDASGLFQVP
jgi:hypothetical protein